MTTGQMQEMVEILEGVRDNLLKPMADDINSKTEKSSQLIKSNVAEAVKLSTEEFGKLNAGINQLARTIDELKSNQAGIRDNLLNPMVEEIKRCTRESEAMLESKFTSRTNLLLLLLGVNSVLMLLVILKIYL